MVFCFLNDFMIVNQWWGQCHCRIWLQSRERDWKEIDSWHWKRELTSSLELGNTYSKCQVSIRVEFSPPWQLILFGLWVRFCKLSNVFLCFLQLFPSPQLVAKSRIQCLVPHKNPPPSYSHPQKCVTMATFPSLTLVTSPRSTAWWQQAALRAPRWNPRQGAISPTAVIQSGTLLHLRTVKWVKWFHSLMKIIRWTVQKWARPFHTWPVHRGNRQQSIPAQQIWIPQVTNYQRKNSFYICQRAIDVWYFSNNMHVQ